MSGHVKTGDGHGACEIENISVGGLFMRTNAPLPVGLAITIELRSKSDSLHVGGRVVSVVTPADAERNFGSPGVGVAFDVWPSETEKRLRALLDVLEKSPESAELTAIASPNDTNVRGLLEMLSDALQKLKERDREIAELRAELKRYKK